MALPDRSHPSSKACLSCRKKHLKCDGQTPVCARCTDSGVPCIMIQSRRGHRTGRRKQNSVVESSSDFIENFDPIPSQCTTLSPTELFLPISQGLPSSSNEITPMPRMDYLNTGDDYLVDIYYQYIHPAHPFILPRKMYIQDRSIFPAHLKNAICFLASHHSTESPDVYRQRSNLVFDTSIPDDGFKVQALILLTLASYARFERDLGNRALAAAIDLAPQIGLNSNSFASSQSPVYQESWRRTWWELYTIASLISFIGGTNLQLSQPKQMALPTHCEDYDTSRQNQLKTSEEMQERFSLEGTFRWSSFSYRIEATRILQSILDITDDTADSRCDAANASISSFLLSIPPDKRDGLKKAGEVDEVMSCALMIIHLASICLHFPRSNLAGRRSFKTVCGNKGGKIPSEKDNAHHFAALRSAKVLSDLISSRPSLKTLSPCASCAITFGAIVQLSECLAPDCTESAYLKEHVQLELSALNVIGETWPIARLVREQIAQFSREILNRSSDISPDLMLMENTDEQWLQNLITEDLGTPLEGFAIPGLQM